MQARSVAQHTYEDVPAALAPLLREVGERRLALERERGGVRLAVPEQEVVREGDGWTVRYRVPLDSEEHNAQVSLLTGHGRRAADARRPGSASCGRSRHRTSARSRGCGGPPPRSASPGRRRCPTRSSSAASTPRGRCTPRSCTRPRASGRGAATRRSTASRPPSARTSRSPRRTRTRPRRCGASRTATCSSAASRPPRAIAPPDWVRAGSRHCPAAMAAGTRRANAVERGVVDLVEAVLLEGREGERFAGRGHRRTAGAAARAGRPRPLDRCLPGAGARSVRAARSRRPRDADRGVLRLPADRASCRRSARPGPGSAWPSDRSCSRSSCSPQSTPSFPSSAS